MSEPAEPRRADNRPDIWARDVAQALRSSRRTAWTVAAVAITVCLVEAWALAAIAPLKTIVPFTITLDRSTGFVSTASGVRAGAQSQTAAAERAFLAQYVLDREGLNGDSGAGAKLLVTIKNIELRPDNEAHVRFEVERRAAGEYAGSRRPYAAIVRFRRKDAPVRMEDRLINPLGFQVTAYRRNDETIGVVGS